MSMSLHSVTMEEPDQFFSLQRPNKVRPHPLPNSSLSGFKKSYSAEMSPFLSNSIFLPFFHMNEMVRILSSTNFPSCDFACKQDLGFDMFLQSVL